MKWLFKFLILISIPALLAASCENSQSKKKTYYSQEELIEANRKKVGRETEIIDAYLDERGWVMTKTPTGLRYRVYGRGGGPAAQSGMFATVTYRAFLLDSTAVASTEISGPRRFKIGEDDVVSGLHEAVGLLNEGDSAHIIIPSYLAYGLTGDKNVPPNAALIYDLQLVDLD